MEGVNCEAFLKTCKHFGCDIVETQAIESIEDNFYDLEVLKKIGNVAFQIITNKIETAVALAKHVEKYVSYIDLNFGCPLKDKLGQKMGGYLLQFPHLMEKIIIAVQKAVSIPITIKIRLGFDETRETYLEIGKLAEKLKVDKIIIHARFVKQGYRGTADWEKIKKLKESISIPVIGNGDITSLEQGEKYVSKGYCDDIMIGRAAKNNPAIFSKEKHSYKEIFNVFYNYYMQQEKKSLNQLQDHASWIVSGEKKATELRVKIRKAESFEAIKEIINL